jgi:hypothetical protein
MSFKTTQARHKHQRKTHFGNCEPCATNGMKNPVHRLFASEKLCFECGAHKHKHAAAFRAEYRCAHYLMQALADHPAVLSVYLDKQDPEEGCSRRRPDVRILCLHGTGIIEIDEHQHRSSNYACVAADIKNKWTDLHLSRIGLSERLKIAEDSRLSEIVNSGSIEPTVVWRWNPDDYRVDGVPCVVSEAERLEALRDDILGWLDQTWEPEHFIQVVYWFYDGEQRQLDFVPMDGDELRAWKASLAGPSPAPSVPSLGPSPAPNLAPSAPNPALYLGPSRAPNSAHRPSFESSGKRQKLE